MGAPLDDAALIQNHDAVGIADGGQPVGDDENRPALHQRVHAGLDLGLGVGIDGGGGLVQDHHRGIRHRRPGDGDELPLALGEPGAVAGEHGLVALGQPGDEVVGVGQLGGVDALLVRGVQLAVADVVHHRAGEQVGLLEHHPQGAAQIGLADFVDVDAVVADFAVVNVVEPVNQVGDGGLACAGGPHEGDLLAGLGVQGHIMEHRLLRHIAEVHMLHIDVALQLLVGGGIVRLVVVLPGPAAGALPGFVDGAVLIDAGVDQVDIALILLRLLIHQVENPLRACQSHDDGVDLVGNLVDGHVEAPGQDHEGHQAAQGQHFPIGQHHHHAPHHRQDGVLDVAQVVVDGAHDVGKLSGGIGVAAELLVQRVEFLFADGFVVEDFHHPLAVNHFLNVPVHRPQGLLLADEILAGFPGQVLGDVDNQGDGKEHDEKQQPTGVDQAPGHHHQGDDGADALGDGLADHLAQGVGVAGEAGHDVARGGGIEVAQGKPLHFLEHLVPDGFLHPLGHSHQQVVHEKGAHNAHAEDGGNFHHKACHGPKVLGAGGHHGQDVVVHQGAQAPAAHGLGEGGEEDAHQDDQKHRGVLLQIAQQPEHGLFGAFRHAAIAAHFHRRHYSSLPFCWVVYRSW